MSKPELVDRAEIYIQGHDALLTPEQLFLLFKRDAQVFKKFNRYLKKNKIKFDMPKKSEKRIERRRVFLHWYVEHNNEKLISECVKELADMLFISEKTIYSTLYNYR